MIFFTKLLLITTVGICANAVSSVSYRSNYEIEKLMSHWNDSYDIARSYSIGKSNNGHMLWVLELTNDKYVLDPIKPHVKLIGGIHGDEPVGRDILIDLINYLINNFYDEKEEIVRLINATHIHILPAMNPDGFDNSTEGVCSDGWGRGNAKGYDLNRNFPSYKWPDDVTGKPEPETRAIMRWLKEYPFILSACIHSGAVVANYPYDYETDEERHRFFLNFRNNVTFINEYLAQLTKPGAFVWKPLESKTEDNDVVKFLAGVYAQNHGLMAKGVNCDEDASDFTDGITNGAAWYPFDGSMQDYNYDFHKCMEITLELSCCKFPNSTDIPRLSSENRKPLLAFLKQGHRGVKGVVTNASKPVHRASVTVFGRKGVRLTTSSGYFWWILLPGSYTIQVEKEGFATKRKEIRVPDDPVAIVLDIKLDVPEPSVTTRSTEVSSGSRVDQKEPFLTSGSSPEFMSVTDKSKSLGTQKCIPFVNFCTAVFLSLVSNIQ